MIFFLVALCAFGGPHGRNVATMPPVVGLHPLRWVVLEGAMVVEAVDFHDLRLLRGYGADQ